MAYYLYNFLLILLSPLLLAWWGISLFNPKYSVGWKERLGFLPSPLVGSLKNDRVIWIHAVSVGEVNAAIPLVQLLRERFPEKKLILSTVTVTGHRTAKAKMGGIDGLFYFPFDLPWVIQRVLRLVHPSVFIFFETELWPNLLEHLNRKKIPAVLVNGRLSDRSFLRYSKIKRFMKGWIQKITFCLMQSEEDRKKIISLGADPERALTTGNTKYDQLKRKQEPPVTGLPLLNQWDWWVAGSTHFGEEEMILKGFGSLNREFPRLGLILAPRHPERFDEVSKLIRRANFSFLKRSALSRESVWNGEHPPVILLDTIGELSDFLYFAAIPFIGGSLVPKGGHNILEAAIWEKAPFFGKHTDNFKEIVEIFKERKAGVEISNENDLVSKISFYLRNRPELDRMGKGALEILYEKQGASRRNLEYIAGLIS